MSVAVLAVVALVAAIVVLLPVALFQSLAAAFEGGLGPESGGRDAGAYRRKTQADLREQARERVAGFLDDHGVAYETDRSFETAAGSVTAPFYLPEREVAVILDDWYDDYLLDKHVDVATVIVELHVTPEHQLGPLRGALGIEAERRPADGRVDVGPDDATVLDLDGGDVSVEELRSAYRERIKETHPDQNDSADAEEEFRRVKEAYENLREQVAD